MRLKAILVGIIVGVALILLILPQMLYKIPVQALRFVPFYTITDPNGTSRDIPENGFLQAFRNASYIPGRYHIDMKLSLDPGASTSGEFVYVIFPYIAGTAMSVYWNGQFFGSQGDITSGNSNIWNSAKIFTVPTSYLRGANNMQVEIQGPYEAGFPRVPYLLPASGNAVFVALLEFFSEKIILMIIGALAVLGIVLILTGTGSPMRPNAMLFLGIASLCTSLFLTDFLTLKTLIIPLLEFKRAVAMLRHLAAIFSSSDFSR